MKNVKKDITFICTDNIEKQCYETVAQEAQRRGYTTRFSFNIFEKCEIGFYSQHLCYPSNSKISCIALHDLGQQHGYWPNMWQNEIWNHFDIGFLPSQEWVDMWHNASCYYFVKPRYGCYYGGWPKADITFKSSFSAECEEIIRKYGIDTSKKTILYAPSWEWDNRQLEIIDACKGLDVNLIIKQAPWNPDVSPLFKQQYEIINELAEKSKNIQGVFVLETEVNIFNAISLCDVLVSEESSTLYEAMLAGKPVIAVDDWFVPDVVPPRLPEFPYDFAIHIVKKDLRETLKKAVTDNDYAERISSFRNSNFPNLGHAASTIMDVIDSVVFNESHNIERIPELPLDKTPSVFKRSVSARKRYMLKMIIKKRIVSKSRLLGCIWNLLRKIKHRKEGKLC